MSTKQAILYNLNMGDMICSGYLGDLTDAEIMLRTVPGINHIAWQLGHLIASENQMVEGACPGSMPPLPAGFTERHAKETSTSDDATKFLKKDEYLALAKQQRAATLAALEKASEDDLAKPAPEKHRSYAPTVADIFNMQGTHWVMHAGQWAVLRRKLGKPPLF